MVRLCFVGHLRAYIIIELKRLGVSRVYGAHSPLGPTLNPERFVGSGFRVVKRFRVSFKPRCDECCGL